MKNIIVLLFIISEVLLIACGGSSSKSESQKISGYQVFRKHCRMCHGANGNMGLNGAKPIPESTLTLEQRIEHITNGKGNMQAYKNILSPAEIEAVAKYTFNLK